MLCRKCGNQKKFQALITYYEPVEIWEFQDENNMERFNQPDTGDLEIKISCPLCNSEDIDRQGYDENRFVESNLNRLEADKWEEKISEFSEKEKTE